MATALARCVLGERLSWSTGGNRGLGAGRQRTAGGFGLGLGQFGIGKPPAPRPRNLVGIGIVRNGALFLFFFNPL